MTSIFLGGAVGSLIASSLYEFGGWESIAFAKELEAGFLAEMLKSAGLGKTSESFGGGAGEDQFSSFLVQEQARAMVDAGGIGLSEAFFNALKERADV